MLSALSAYIRDLLGGFSPSLVPAWRAHGATGIYMCCCGWVLRTVPSPVSIDRFGKLDNRDELLNYIGNFCCGELRNDTVEAYLRSHPEPTIVDVGVNIGVTCRWWLSLSPNARVIGIDMMEEAIDFTRRKLTALGLGERFIGIVAAAGEKNDSVTIQFDSPLLGTVSLSPSSGHNVRTVPVKPVDAMISPFPKHGIALLKLDVEGHGYPVLKGAAETLTRTQAVVFEGHTEEETSQCAALLQKHGFQLLGAHGRNYWWMKPLPSTR